MSGWVNPCGTTPRPPSGLDERAFMDWLSGAMRRSLDVRPHTHMLPPQAIRLGGSWACVECGTILEVRTPVEARD